MLPSGAVPKQILLTVMPVWPNGNFPAGSMAMRSLPWSELDRRHFVQAKVV
jgi:hypothetical protein